MYKLKLKEGKKYLRNDGGVTGELESRDVGRFYDPKYEAYYIDGGWFFINRRVQNLSDEEQKMFKDSNLVSEYQESKNNFKVEIGKRYIRADGEITDYIERGGVIYGFFDPKHNLSYTAEGHILHPKYFKELTFENKVKVKMFNLIEEYKNINNINNIEECVAFNEIGQKTKDIANQLLKLKEPLYVQKTNEKVFFIGISLGGDLVVENEKGFFRTYFVYELRN